MKDFAHRMEAVTISAVRLWGAQRQFRQLTEECGELIAAVNQYERGRITADQLASEIADVLIIERLELRIAHAQHAAEVP